MGDQAKRSWFDVLVDFSPILALLLVWLSVAQKATKVGNPHTWLVGLTTLPALAAILYAAWVVYKGSREPLAVSNGKQARAVQRRGRQP